MENLFINLREILKILNLLFICKMFVIFKGVKFNRLNYFNNIDLLLYS